MLIGYTVQNVTKVWMALPQTTEMQSFSKMVYSYFMINHTRNAFEVFSRMEDGFASRWQANDIAEATRPMSEDKE